MTTHVPAAFLPPPNQERKHFIDAPLFDICLRCGSPFADPDDAAPAWWMVTACAACLSCTSCCGHDDDEALW